MRTMFGIRFDEGILKHFFNVYEGTCYIGV